MDYTKVSIDNIHYYHPIFENNRYVAKISYQMNDDDEVPLRIVTPALRAKNGICVSDNRCYLQLELDRHHEDFYNFFTDLDDKNIRVMFNNCKAWFGKSIPLYVLDDNYITFIKASRRPYIKVKIPLKNGRIDIDDDTDISEKDIEEGTLVKLVMEYEGIRFYQRKAINIWKVKGIRIIEDDEDIQYDFHPYEDEMEDLMLQELNLTIQEAIDKANNIPEENIVPSEEDYSEEENIVEEISEDDREEDVALEEDIALEEDVALEEDESEQGGVLAEDVVLENNAVEVQDGILVEDEDGSSSGLSSVDVFDDMVDRVLGNVVDPKILEAKRRRKKIIVGDRVVIV